VVHARDINLSCLILIIYINKRLIFEAARNYLELKYSFLIKWQKAQKEKNDQEAQFFDCN